jgi:hypothetical protein
MPLEEIRVEMKNIGEEKNEKERITLVQPVAVSAYQWRLVRN